MKKAALFDLDGTIAETLESIAYSTNLTTKEFGYPPVPAERFKTIVGDGAENQIRRIMEIHGVRDEEVVQKILKRYLEIFADGCTHEVVPCRGVPELILEMKNKGLRLGVCSNKPHLQTLKVVNSAYPEGTFDVILGQQAGIPKKPAPEMPLRVAEELGALPEECLYLGDTNTDMRTGKGAGMFTIGVLWGFREKEELVSCGADAIAEIPADVLNYL